MDDAFYEQGRQRAFDERESVEWAVAEIHDRCLEADIDLEPLVEKAAATLEGIPSRHAAAFEGMADVLAVDRDVYAAYAFAFSDVASALSDATTGAEPIERDERSGTGAGGSGEGCTNVLVSPSRSATDGPLVCKNRDIVGRGVRPVAVVEQPAIGPYHGYITVDTCGEVLLYKGVNDAGLVVANTHIDVSRREVEPGEGVRNGTVVRRILEECASVAEARALVDSYPERLFTGQTLILADADHSVVLEIDPIAESIHPVDDPVVARTNHFVETESPVPDSSDVRLERARERLEALEGPFDRDDLEAVATDHENGPGEYSICRHAGERADHHLAFGQETTVSASIFEGGRTAVDAAIGYPCVDGFERYAFGEEIPDELQSGQRWLAFAT